MSVLASPAELPKVLLLSHEVPEMESAGGIVLYRLFQNYPPDNVFIIGRAVSSQARRLPFRSEVLPFPWERFERSRFHKWKRSLRAFGLAPVVDPANIQKLLNGFDPDVVITVMQFSRYYDAAFRYAKSARKPLVCIVHDVNEEFEKVFPCALQYNRRRDAAFYKYCSRRLCVSPEMEELCYEWYGTHGSIQYPNRSEDLLPRRFEEAFDLKAPGKLSLGFAGNLNYGYGAALVKMLPVLRQTGSRLIIFSRPPGEDAAALMEAKDCCDYRGFMPMPPWDIIKKECDAVLLAYPNPAAERDVFYKYHFPSKLPEYLALGMPVIVTGPQSATGVKWALRNPDAAIACTEKDLSDFLFTIEELKRNPDLRYSLSQKAIESGNRDFDPLIIQRCFIDHIKASVFESNA